MRPLGYLGAVLTIGAAPLAAAASPPESGLAVAAVSPAAPLSRAELDALSEALRLQNEKLDRQAGEIEAQRREIERQREELRRLSRQLLNRGGVPAAAPALAAPTAATLGRPGEPVGTNRLDATRAAAGTERTAQAQPPAAGQEQQRQQEERTRPPDIEVLADVGGVLTRRGTLIVDPQFEYSHASLNRFFFQGVEIVDAVLIGIIEATDSDRDTFTPSIGFRYGITDRLEVDARIPYVYRDDRVTNTEVATGTSNIQDLTGHGLGDIEFGVHYQINRGRGGWPFFIGNVRVKTDTGTGPFDVSRDARGIETELATGSGFWAVEPSITVIYPTDPAVLFANIGYLWNIERDIDKQIGASQIGTVDPGDAVNVSFGVGFALNESVSLNFGYQHSYVQGTRTELNGVSVRSNSLQVGSFLFGMSYRISPGIGLNVNLAAGLTEDAPDAQVTVRVPVSFNLFD